MLGKINFDNILVNWIEAILIKGESCVINSAKTMQYFHWNGEACQGDSVPSYGFTLVMEVSSTLRAISQVLDMVNYPFYLFSLR